MQSKTVKMLAASMFLSSAFLAAPSVHAEETMKEKAVEVGQDIKKNTKKGVRKVKDATCEMINGKMECLAKKAKHKAQDVGGEIKDATDTE